MSKKKKRTASDSDLTELDIKAVVQQSQHIPVNLREFVKHMAMVIKKERLTTEELAMLYDAIKFRLVSKNCYRCGKLKLAIEGVVVWVDGDMSKPKRFICRDCK